jgi:hypothetical protein
MGKHSAFIKNIRYLKGIYNYNPATQYKLFCMKTRVTLALAGACKYGSDANVYDNRSHSFHCRCSLDCIENDAKNLISMRFECILHALNQRFSFLYSAFKITSTDPG